MTKALAPAFGRARPAGLRVLHYHRLGSPDAGGLAVSPNEFARQLDFLLASGHRVVPLGDVPRLIKSAASDLGRYVVITFDDGYRDGYSRALPLLADRGLRASFFISVGFVDSGDPFPWVETPARDRESLPLTWSEVEAMSRAGMEVQSHGTSHRDLTRLSPEDVRQEMMGSGVRISAALGVRPAAFCYPFGYHTRETARLAADAGYAMACTCVPGTAHPSSDLLTLRRTKVEGSDTMTVFRARLDGAFDWALPYYLKEAIKSLFPPADKPRRRNKAGRRREGVA